MTVKSLGSTRVVNHIVHVPNHKVDNPPHRRKGFSVVNRKALSTQQPDEEREKLRLRVVEAIDSCGRQQAQIARDTGADPARVSRWANPDPKQGEVPGWKYLPRLPGALGVSGHWLLTNEGPMRRPHGEEALHLQVIGRIVDGEIDAGTLRALATQSPEGTPVVGATQGSTTLEDATQLSEADDAILEDRKKRPLRKRARGDPHSRA